MPHGNIECFRSGHSSLIIQIWIFTKAPPGRSALYAIKCVGQQETCTTRNTSSCPSFAYTANSFVASYRTCPESCTLSSKLTFFTAETATQPFRLGSQSIADMTLRSMGNRHHAEHPAEKGEALFSVLIDGQLVFRTTFAGYGVRNCTP